jgi:hypothetical protein
VARERRECTETIEERTAATTLSSADDKEDRVVAEGSVMGISQLGWS